MKTYVLIQAAPGAAEQGLSGRIGALPGVGRVVDVSGPYDMVAEVEAHDLLTRATLPRLLGLEGVLHAIPLHVVDRPGEEKLAG